MYTAGNEGSGSPVTKISTAEVPDLHGNNAWIIASSNKDTGSWGVLDETDRQGFPGPGASLASKLNIRLCIAIGLLAQHALG
jgi:hypothetical protein